jgi:glycosyltransferase involved in cell wall biosynthesis
MVLDILIQEDPDIVYIHQVLNLSLIELLARSRPTVRFVHDLKLVCPDGKKTLQSKKISCPFPLGYRCQIRAYHYNCMPRNPLIGLPLIYDSKGIAKMHRFLSHMVVPSRFMKSALLYNGFSDDKIDIIPYFTYLPKQKKDQPSAGEPIILFLGRIVRAKGVHCLLHAFAMLKRPSKIVIAGDGPDLNEMKALATKLGISSRVSFPGWILHYDLDSFYRQCSLVVVPSIYPESFGIVGIEAMAYQKPVVAFDTGGISEWLGDGETGFLVKPGDERALSEKIDLILSEPALAHEMGKRGRDNVNARFVAKAHLGRLLPLFQKAIESFHKNDLAQGNLSSE